ncbi:hypothetical protein ASPTUDRAFT_46021 [Aspergillus tubingensis CBS 134.48]|uniref:Uncharacterized protein n=1 Tax=Aspergillus tubingensis (strain CBS 134.48) TaxID=767770 RepID=A0A1L9MVC9_ASPTC|nr:hypothetical protein ASPTUDRAFT_46021 [Aspergillus tubingensis CBS 134.48]
MLVFLACCLAALLVLVVRMRDILGPRTVGVGSHFLYFTTTTPYYSTSFVGGV